MLVSAERSSLAINQLALQMAKAAVVDICRLPQLVVAWTATADGRHKSPGGAEESREATEVNERSVLFAHSIFVCTMNLLLWDRSKSSGCI